MIIILQNEVFNLNRFDSVRPKNASKDKNDRIAFFRDSEEVEYVAFNTHEERDAEWGRLKGIIAAQYE